MRLQFSCRPCVSFRQGLRQDDRSRIILQPVPLESLLLSTKRLERDDQTHRGKERDPKGIMCYSYPCRYHKTIFVVLQSFVLHTR